MEDNEKTYCILAVVQSDVRLIWFGKDWHAPLLSGRFIGHHFYLICQHSHRYYMYG